jgi:hypothetical protein
MRGAMSVFPTILFWFALTCCTVVVADQGKQNKKYS